MNRAKKDNFPSIRRRVVWYTIASQRPRRLRRVQSCVSFESPMWRSQ